MMVQVLLLKIDLRIVLHFSTMSLATLHWRPAIGPSCTEFVYPACWHFDNVAKSFLDYVLLQYRGEPPLQLKHTVGPAKIVTTWDFLG